MVQNLFGQRQKVIGSSLKRTITEERQSYPPDAEMRMENQVRREIKTGGIEVKTFLDT